MENITLSQVIDVVNGKVVSGNVNSELRVEDVITDRVAHGALGGW